MVVMRMEEVESEQKKEDIDDVIYENYNEFKPYVYLFEDIAGLTSEAEVRFLKIEGREDYTKSYRISKGELDYRLSVDLNLNHPERGLRCKIEVT